MDDASLSTVKWYSVVVMRNRHLCGVAINWTCAVHSNIQQVTDTWPTSPLLGRILSKAKEKCDCAPCPELLRSCSANCRHSTRLKALQISLQSASSLCKVLVPQLPTQGLSELQKVSIFFRGGCTAHVKLSYNCHPEHSMS